MDWKEFKDNIDYYMQYEKISVEDAIQAAFSDCTTQDLFDILASNPEIQGSTVRISNPVVINSRNMQGEINGKLAYIDVRDVAHRAILEFARSCYEDEK